MIALRLPELLSVMDGKPIIMVLRNKVLGQTMVFCYFQVKVRPVHHLVKHFLHGYEQRHFLYKFLTTTCEHLIKFPNQALVSPLLFIGFENGWQ